MTLQEQKYGSVRLAAAHFGIESSYWWRMRDEELTNPSKDTLKLLGLREVTTIYEEI